MRIWLNPIPVAVLLLPVDDGLLAVRRGIPPGIGELALPGGYVNPNGERMVDAACRELREELCVSIDPAKVNFLMEAADARLNLVISFWLAPWMRSKDLPPFDVSEEAQERLVVPAGTRLVFPTHTEALDRYFSARP
jgi:ADP-ribose pyrophosphatase YjhB (NUDIX family)